MKQTTLNPSQRGDALMAKPILLIIADAVLYPNSLRHSLRNTGAAAQQAPLLVIDREHILAEELNPFI